MNKIFNKLYLIELKATKFLNKYTKIIALIILLSNYIGLAYILYSYDIINPNTRLIILLSVSLFIVGLFLYGSYTHFKLNLSKKNHNVKNDSLVNFNTNLDDEKNELLINFLSKWFSSGKGSSEIYLYNDLMNLINLNLTDIGEGGLISETSKKIDIGRVLFQLVEVGIWQENDVKKVYANKIIKYKGSLNSFDLNTYNDHKRAFSIKNNLYKNPDINIPQLFNKNSYL